LRQKCLNRPENPKIKIKPMTCPNCRQATEDTAAFCGNCGHTLSPIAQVMNNQPKSQASGQSLPGPLATAGISGTAAGVPSYALTKPSQHTGETKALLALILGVAGIAGALFMALIGLALGVAGIIMGTMSRVGPKRNLSTAGLFLSSFAILASLAVWTYAVRHDPRLSQNSSPAANGTSAPAVAASDISTPCYSAGFVDQLNVSNGADSCDMNAFNGSNLNSSTEAYKVYAYNAKTVNPQDYASIFKPALEKDIRTNLPGFVVDSEASGSFAGSPAYIVNTSDKAQGIAVVEAAVLHSAGPGENVFVMAHVVNGKAADLTTLEAQWQWK
jgi:hypothetical protein